MLSDWIFGLFIALVVGFVGLVVWAAVEERGRPEFSLKKDDWTCTKTRPRVILVGKVPTVTHQCIEYQRVR